MKKLSLLLGMCALLLSACEKEGLRRHGPEDPKGNVVFKITTDDAPTTRGGAFYGAEAQSAVTAATVYSFVETGGEFLFDKAFAVTPWNATSGSYAIEGATLGGNYKFIAVGTEDVNPYEALAPEAGVTDYDTFNASLTGGAETATPIYSGIPNNADAAIAFTVGEFQEVPIIIRRAVAGILVYVKNVPVDIDGQVPATLELRTTAATNLSTSVLLFNGTPIIGAPTGTTTTLMTIDLDQGDDGSFYNSNDLPEDVVSLDFSQLGGTYVLPTENVGLTLGLYEAGGAMIKEWPVSIDGSTTGTLERNVLYALGTKNLSTSTFGSDETPDSDPAPTDDKKDDNAIDIMNQQLILVEVDGAWGSLKNLTIH